MKTRFGPNRPPQLRRPEPKKAPNPPKPLIFDFSVAEFKGIKGVLSFKFVYRLTTDRLVIGPMDTPHRKIAQHVFGKGVAKSEIIGGVFMSQDKGNTMFFMTHGRSGYYGIPDQAQMRRVAEHIAGQLGQTVVTEADGNLMIEGEISE